MQVILMSGIPGSGKSTLAKELGGPLTVVCSADDYFVDPIKGAYNFDPSKLSEAHGACMRKFVSHLLLDEADTIIVDNTNLTALELAPYVAVAAAHHASVEIVTVNCNVDVAVERNTHNVPIGSIRRMARTLLDRALPPYWNVIQTVR